MRPTDLPPIPESFLHKDHPLHRPRHGRRQRVALICAMIFFLIPAGAYAVGVRPQAFENHRLAAFPSITRGWGFFTALPNWATDNLPGRQAGVHAEAGISQSIFGEPPAFSGTDRQGTPIGPVGQVQTAPPPPDPLNGGQTDFSQVIEGRNGWLYYAQDMTSKCDPDQPISATIQDLATLRSAIEASGRSLVLVVAPDKSTAEPRFLPPTYPDKDCAAQASTPFWQGLVDTDGALDLRPGLSEAAAQSGRPIYYKQDTHWNDLGSLVMLRAVADQIDPGVTGTWQSVPDGVVEPGADLPPMIASTGRNTEIHYTLGPDGGADRTGPTLADMPRAVRFAGAPTAGMVNEPVAILGDSFLAHASRYLPAVFSDATAIDYASMDTDQAGVESVLASGKVIVIEVVERVLTAGDAPFLRPDVIGGLRSYLAAHPAP
ncbi:MAG TPA: hypothetical protein VFW65_06640 [Pseudonocardiaceae bacterium]|nr:hypothetical protein [Pseudonocardiaceae bacterium]